MIDDMAAHYHRDEGIGTFPMFDSRALMGSAAHGWSRSQSGRGLGVGSK